MSWSSCRSAAKPRRAQQRRTGKALEEAREEAAAAENVIQGHGLKMDGRQRRAQESAQQREQLSRQAAAMEDRIRLLTEMEKEYEGFSQCGEAGDAGGGQGRPAGRPRPGGQPHDHAGAIHRGHRDRLGRRPAEYRGGHARTTPSPPSAT